MPPLAASWPPNRHPALSTPCKQRGMTLVELVITIVIIGIAAAALFSAMASIAGRSADPMLRQQSLYIAEAYLETLQALPYMDLDDKHELAQGEGGPPKGLDGEVIPELKAYRVRTRIIEEELNEVTAKRIIVIVEDPSEEKLELTGWRTCYGEDGCPL